MRISESLLFYPWESLTENNCNSYIIDGSVKVLIDPGHLHLMEHLINGMKGDGLSPQDIDLIIVTHPHPDHAEGLADRRYSKALKAMHRDAKLFLEEFSRLWKEMIGKDVPEFPVDFFLKEGTLKVGNKTLKILETPGHAPGSISIYLEEDKILFPGDVIFARSFGRFDLPGSDPVQLVRSIEKLAGLDIEILAPGHGPVIKGRGTVKENFYLVFAIFQEMLSKDDSGAGL